MKLCRDLRDESGAHDPRGRVANRGGDHRGRALAALWPRNGADRAFIFVLAIALGIALAVAFSGGGGGGQYPPSVQRAIEQAQDVAAAPPTPQRTALGCVWRGLLAASLVLVGVLVLLSMICGDGRVK